MAIDDWEARLTIAALDTSAAGGSVAVIRDGALVLERAGDPLRSHSERLPRELMTLLDDAGVALAEVDQFAVCIGPGSYTGLRIGIATIQGLALAAGKLVTPVSTFEALAFSIATCDLPPASVDHHPPPSAVRPPSSDLRPPSAVLRPPSSSPKAIWIDAHRGEVFAMLYGADGGVLHGATSLTPDATLDLWQAELASPAVRFIGDGALKYRAAIEARVPAALVDEAMPPLAGAIGLLAATHPSSAVRPHVVVPLYVRRSDVELARDRRQPPDRG